MERGLAAGDERIDEGVEVVTVDEAVAVEVGGARWPCIDVDGGGVPASDSEP